MISNCCGAYAYNTDCDICPDCKEHCEFEEEDEIDMEDDSEIINLSKPN